MSLFERIEDFPLQEDYLFNLQEDLLGDDFENASFLNLDVGLEDMQQPIQCSLGNLVASEKNDEFFGESWMEFVELSSLLNDNVKIPPAVEVCEPKQEPEPRKEGLKASAFDLLKRLLTGQDPEPKEEVLQSVELLPATPENQVLDLQFLSTPLDTNIDLLINNEENFSSNCLEDLIEHESEYDTSKHSVILDDHDSQTVASESIAVSQPPSIQSVDSISYGPDSPDSIELNTIDSSHLNDSNDSSSSDSFSQVSELDFTNIKSVSKTSKRSSKSRSTPYDAEPAVADKKVRKKVQNKNAATRYRVKKRQEKDSLQTQEVRLTDKNKELKEKVESLQREISYMKELMSEIQKAKQNRN